LGHLGSIIMRKIVEKLMLTPT